jgi:putative oxidoreductase
VEPVTGPKLLHGWWIPDAAWLALRLAAAMLLVWHGVQEHFGLLVPPGAKWAGPPIQFSQSWYAATIELAGGALLAMGLFTRSVAFALTALGALAYFEAQRRGLWMLNGEELIVLYSCVLLAFALIGPGLFSVDALISGRRMRSPAMTVPLSPWIRRQYRRRELTR